MRRFKDNKALQFACAQTLGSQTLFHAANSEIAGQLGAVEEILDIMRRFSDDPQAQLASTSGCFMDLSYDNRVRWKKAGGMETALAAMRNHYWNHTVHFEVWCAFSSGTKDPNEEHFVGLGGIETVVQVMKDHPKSYRVREECMQSMRQVGEFSAAHRSRAYDAGFYDMVIVAMRDAPFDLHQVSSGCANLNIAATDNATIIEALVEAGAVELLFQAVVDFPRMIPPNKWVYDDQYTIYYECIMGMARMARRSEAAKERLRRKDAVEVVRNLMAKAGGHTQLSGWTLREVMS